MCYGIQYFMRVFQKLLSRQCFNKPKYSFKYLILGVFVYFVRKMRQLKFMVYSFASLTFIVKFNTYDCFFVRPCLSGLIANASFHFYRSEQIQQTTTWWYFPQKTGFDMSCKLSPLETICMKCLILFPGKNKKSISKCRLLKNLPGVLSVNFFFFFFFLVNNEHFNIVQSQHFIYFSENRIWYFIQIFFSEDNLQKKSRILFSLSGKREGGGGWGGGGG